MMEAMKITHAHFWRSVDRIAAAHALSTSGLAKRLGLDPRCLNKSKRVQPNGNPRWPSIEVLFKILDATNMDPNGFFNLGRTDSSVPFSKLGLKK